jgi:hypothetical protein
MASTLRSISSQGVTPTTTGGGGGFIGNSFVKAAADKVINNLPALNSQDGTKKAGLQKEAPGYRSQKNLIGVLGLKVVEEGFEEARGAKMG